MTDSSGALTGSREPSPAVSALSGFDPARVRQVFPIGSFAPGNYTGLCHDCGRQMDGVDKRALSCFDCAAISFKRSFDLIDSALRIRIWNEAKAKGLSDDIALRFVTEQRAIAIEAATAGEAARLDPEGTTARACKASPNLEDSHDQAR